MPSYRKADADLHELVQTIIDAEQAHHELYEHGVTVAVLLAEDGVTLHGYECFAIVRKTGTRERAQGCADAVIIIDEFKWGNLSNEVKVAMLDHELTHLTLDRDKEGDVKIDNLGRPKITLRRHDWQIGGFKAMFERHGQDSIEVQQVLNAAERFGQTFFGFAEVKLPEKSKNGKSQRTKQMNATIRKAIEDIIPDESVKASGPVSRELRLAGAAG